jgi:hypothetical protein
MLREQEMERAKLARRVAMEVDSGLAGLTGPMFSAPDQAAQAAAFGMPAV